MSTFAWSFNDQNVNHSFFQVVSMKNVITERKELNISRW